MEIIFLLIVVSIFFIAILAYALFWSVKSGQFDDLEGHAYDILMDDENIKDDKEKNVED